MKQQKTIYYIYSLISIVLLLVGCTYFAHTFYIQFKDINGLMKDDSVLFNNTSIGNVTDIEYTDKGYFLVKVSIEDQFSSLPKNSSIFYIDSNSNMEGHKAVLMIQSENGGETIAENSVVKGQSKYATVYRQIFKNFGDSLQKLETEIINFLQELQNFSESEQIEQLERQLDEILANMEAMSMNMRQKLETDILPHIKEKLEELRRRFEKTGKEERLKKVEEKLQTISEKSKL